HRRIRRVAGVVERCPASRASYLVRVAVPAVAEDEPDPPVLLEVRSRGEQPVGPRAPARGGGDDERLDRSLQGVRKCGPARIAVLAREDELCACQAHRQLAEAGERLRIALASVPDELLRLLSELLEVHRDLLP